MTLKVLDLKFNFPEVSLKLQDSSRSLPKENKFHDFTTAVQEAHEP